MTLTSNHCYSPKDAICSSYMMQIMKIEINLKIDLTMVPRGLGCLSRVIVEINLIVKICEPCR